MVSFFRQMTIDVNLIIYMHIISIKNWKPPRKHYLQGIKKKTYQQKIIITYICYFDS